LEAPSVNKGEEIMFPKLAKVAAMVTITALLAACTVEVREASEIRERPVHRHTTVYEQPLYDLRRSPRPPHHHARRGRIDPYTVGVCRSKSNLNHFFNTQVYNVGQALSPQGPGCGWRTLQKRPYYLPMGWRTNGHGVTVMQYHVMSDGMSVGYMFLRR